MASYRAMPAPKLQNKYCFIKDVVGWLESCFSDQQAKNGHHLADPHT